MSKVNIPQKSYRIISITIVIIFLIAQLSCSQQKAGEIYLINKNYNGPAILIYGDLVNGIKIKDLKNIYDFRKVNLIRIKENMPENDFIGYDNIEFFNLSENARRTKIPILLNESGIKNDTTKYAFLYNSQIGDRNHKISYRSIIISDKTHYRSSVKLQDHLLDSLSR